MPSRIKSMFLLFLAQTCVGISIVASKSLIDHINPVIILTIRFSLSCIFMFIFLLRSKESNRFKLNLSAREWLILIACGWGAVILFNLLMLSGLHFTSANSTGLITSLLPAVVICLNVIFFKQKLNRKMLFSIAISVAGLILINYSAISSNSKGAFIGNLLVLLALIPDGLYYTLSQYYPLRLHPILKVVLLIAVNLPPLYLIAVFMPSSYWSVITIEDWLVMLFVGFTSGLFFWFWQKGIQGVDATYSALSTAFMPLTTVILAWIILGETLSFSKFIGMILIILSIVSYSRK